MKTDLDITTELYEHKKILINGLINVKQIINLSEEKNSELANKIIKSIEKTLNKIRKKSN